MLTADLERYLQLRQTLGYRLRDASRQLRAFAARAIATGDTTLRTSTAVAWALEGPSPNARYVRLQHVRQLARFLHAENPAHEIPPDTLVHYTKIRPLPYIYTPDEVGRLLRAAGRLRQTYGLRRSVYRTLIGLIAATGLRVSEALNLRLADVRPDGVLQIRHTKFGKSRLLPLHPTVAAALGRYLTRRQYHNTTDDHVFLSASHRRIASSMVNYTFRRLLRLADVGMTRGRRPRIHDLRHTFATRALERCATSRDAVARHFVALATYLGHSDIANTYWYLDATPVLFTGIADAAEALMAGEAR